MFKVGSINSEFMMPFIYHSILLQVPDVAFKDIGLTCGPMLMVFMSSSPVGPSSRPGGSLPAIAPAFGT